MKKFMFVAASLALVSTTVSANIVQDYVAGKVVRAICPEDKPLLDDEGFCHSCFELGEVKILKNRDIIDMCHTKEGKPIREEVDGHFGRQNTYLIACPDVAPLKAKEMGCLSCDYPGNLNLTEEECSKCNKSGKNIRIYENGVCKLSDCTNKPLKGIDGGCYPCDFKEDITMLSGTCEKTCPNRRVSFTSSYGAFSTEGCVLKEKGKATIPNNCPPEKPILDDAGECRSCDFYRENIHAFSGCDKCPNREAKGAWFSDVGNGIMCHLKG